MILIKINIFQVSMFRKTRHENLVLFMGACMKPPRLAIVTSLIKGMTLYTHIHLRKDKFNMNRTTNVAQQISQVWNYKLYLNRQTNTILIHTLLFYILCTFIIIYNLNLFLCFINNYLDIYTHLKS